MIDDLPNAETAWLTRFFAAPNQLLWAEISIGQLAGPVADQLRPWLQSLLDPGAPMPMVLPFLRNGTVSGWYAVSRDQAGGRELAADLEAWFGPSFMSLCQVVPVTTTDPMATSLRDRFGGVVYRFTGPDALARERIGNGVRDMGALWRRKPATIRSIARPVGAIRSDFERALLAQDPVRAEALVAELRDTGRLNEENLQFLQVRLRAGLGYWPQLARDKWLLTALSDLPLPPQTLSDVIEALYRTYIDAADEAGDGPATLQAFRGEVVGAYPRLFASRRGVRTPRVVKAFLLYELVQAEPNRKILDDLLALLPPAEQSGGAYEAFLAAATPFQPEPQTTERAEVAFDDAQFDRAFEFFLSLPLERKVVTRLVQCARVIGTADARERLVAALETAQPDVLNSLSDGLQAQIAGMRAPLPLVQAMSPAPAVAGSANAPGWMAWAQAVAAGQDLERLSEQVQDGAAVWDVAPFSKSEASSQALADILGNIEGDGIDVVRRALPIIQAAFFDADQPIDQNTKPLASMLFDLLAMGDVVSRVDLDLVSQLLTRLLQIGLSSQDYALRLRDLADLENRVTSYATLPWSLDVCESLALEPCPSQAAREARLGFFTLVLSHAQGFAHRLGPQDILAFEYLACDFGVDPDSLSVLRSGRAAVAPTTALADLNRKTIGIYTLMEAAGSRAKTILESMFAGCRVVVNSDMVATAQLNNLAKVADIFVFAWKSSSHQAFFCVKDAPPKVEPVWAQGKGTASIIRAVLDQLT